MGVSVVSHTSSETAPSSCCASVSLSASLPDSPLRPDSPSDALSGVTDPLKRQGSF